MKSINSTENLIFIELFRGIFAFGVVCVHGSSNFKSNLLDKLLVEYIFIYAVPFFIFASLFFNLNSAKSNNFNKFNNSKIKRLVLPYLIWSFIYFISRYSIGRIQFNFDSIIKSVFLGAAAVQLYFIPLIYIALILLFLIQKVTVNWKIKSLSIGFLISLITYYILICTGNSFQLNSSIAFEKMLKNFNLEWIYLNPFLNVILVYISFSIRSLPYSFAAIIFYRLQENKRIIEIFSNKFILFLLIFLFLTLNIFKIDAVSEVVLGILFFIFPSIISNKFKVDDITKYIFLILGSTSYSVYLCHHLLIQLFTKLHLLPSIDLISASIGITILSIVIIIYFRRYKKLNFIFP